MKEKSKSRPAVAMSHRTKAMVATFSPNVGALAPRIYNLFPSLIGSVSDWVGHLPRIAAMGFDWVYVNPFHCPGFSGSLYAVKDSYRLSDLARGGEPARDDDALLRRFTREAERNDLHVMMDLVVNHSAKDSPLTQEHPEWYRRNFDGTLYSPRVADPDDPNKVTIWGDLAEFDYGSPGARAGLIEYWSRYVRHYAGLGFQGFRCDAAYHVPAEVWRPIIAAGRHAAPGVAFVAETLGCTPEQVSALAGADFDYIFNSAKWWDFRAGWLLEQYDRFRRLAPSIAFPESHDTERLAAQVSAEGDDRIEPRLKFQLLFSACFSAGVMMPVGFEYGFRRKLDVVRTRPTDWEETGLDLTAFVAAVNRMKASVPALNTEGPQRRITAPDNPIVGLLRLSGGHPVASGGCAITLINPGVEQAQAIEVGPLITETGGTFRTFTDVTPLATPLAFEPGATIALEPLEIRVFRGDQEARALGQEDLLPAATTAAAVSQRDLEEFARNRIAIEHVYPEIDAGRFAVKRVVGDVLEVWADIFADGHDELQARVKYKTRDQSQWQEAPMSFFDNDRWVGRFPLIENTDYLYAIEAWRDLFGSWCADLVKKRDAGQDLRLVLAEGRILIEKAAIRAHDGDREFLESTLVRATALGDQPAQLATLLLDEELHETVVRSADRTNLSRYPIELRVIVDRQAASFSAWYELFPRSQSGAKARSGTFDDVIARLPYVRDMGFDVLYFPPIHPIGRTNRKGRNNSLVAGPSDPGSPYAIGSEEGGHTAIHPELGTLDDFRRLVGAAHDHGLEIALDFAIQCSPDHPWIKEHPEWFDWRPDGTIKYAENPPKKYEDIVNLHLYREAFPSAWYALRDVILFWVDQGVKIFRIDNPHTKPLPFWEWMIGDVRQRHPEVIFLAEAFTRPKIMKRLAKLGFTQSYTYFTWRNTKQELTAYLTELAQEEPKEYYRPNFFTNTPDINPFFLQTGGRAAFIARATLAATLSSSYGIYSGFEICEATPISGKEEYLDSEKYEIKVWDWNRPGNIRVHIRRLNQIRRENPALHDFRNLRFYDVDNDQILLYGKMTPAKDNAILIAVSLDPHKPQGGDFEVPLWEFDLPDEAGIGVEDLLSGATFQWHGKRQHVRLDPQTNPCAIWRLTLIRAKT